MYLEVGRFYRAHLSSEDASATAIVEVTGLARNKDPLVQYNIFFHRVSSERFAGLVGHWISMPNRILAGMDLSILSELEVIAEMA